MAVEVKLKAFCKNGKSSKISKTLLGISYLVFTFASFASQNFFIMFTWGGLSLCFCLLYLKWHPKFELMEEERIPIFFLSLIILSCLVVLPFSGFRSISNLAYFIYIGLIFLVAHLFSKSPQYFYDCLRGALFVVQIGLISIVILHTASDPLGSLVGGSSANGITSYLIVLQACYNVLHFRHKDTFPSWMLNLLTLFICYVGFGRGSIVASLMLLSINFIYGFYRSEKRRWIYVALVFCGVATFVVKYDAILDLLNHTNLARGLYDQPRIEMWVDYYRSINLTGFFFGSDFKGTIIGDFYLGNPHNSFIRAHNKFGLGYVVLLLMSPLVIFIKNQNNSKGFYLMATLLVIFFRGMTEPILFPTLVDVFYFTTLYSIVRLNYREGSISRVND